MKVRTVSTVLYDLPDQEFRATAHGGSLIRWVLALAIALSTIACSTPPEERLSKAIRRLAGPEAEDCAGYALVKSALRLTHALSGHSVTSDHFLPDTTSEA